MSVTVKRLADDRYAITSEGTELVLDTAALEELHAELTEILRPDTAAEKRAQRHAFMEKLATASDVGIQALLITAGHDDILVLLRAAESAPALSEKLHANMTEKSARLYAEDLSFMFRDAIPVHRLDEATQRLIALVDDLAEAGTLTFEVEETPET
jgi:flagellar motor switch protein FliG